MNFVHSRLASFCSAVLAAYTGALAQAQPEKLLPADWDPKAAADKVMAGLINTSEAHVKGAHDAEFVMIGDKAFIVAVANDIQGGENPAWPYLYVTLTIVNAKTLAVEKTLVVAKSEQMFANETLPVGACFVPRIIQKDDKTLRCYFASEEPGKRQSQMWYRDFDVKAAVLAPDIHKVKITTSAGTNDMQPKYLYDEGVKLGLTRPMSDYGLYIFDSFKVFDGKTYVALNNYISGQNALSVVNADLDTFEVLGQYITPVDLKLTESAVNRLPDGTWMAICRQEGTKNYTFSTSKDGRTWTPNESRDPVQNGTSSKPVFEKFNGVYYLGWQEATQINNVHRSVFNVEVSRDGEHWERKYRFETEHSFQYPSFHQHEGKVWLTLTQGDTDPSRKERIMFGRLE